MHSPAEVAKNQRFPIILGGNDMPVFPGLPMLKPVFPTLLKFVSNGKDLDKPRQFFKRRLEELQYLISRFIVKLATVILV